MYRTARNTCSIVKLDRKSFSSILMEIIKNEVGEHALFFIRGGIGGLSKSQVSRWFISGFDGTVLEWYRLCDALGVDADEIIKRADELTKFEYR